MAESDIFVSNDVEMDVDFGEVFVIDQGVVYKIVVSKYNNTATYVVGAYVLHLEKLYRCITAIEEPEEFNAEKWTQVLLANEVQIANANIALKANADDVYDKTAIDNKVSDINAAIALKANSADVYAKTETYNQTEVDNALATKADADTTYSKTEVDDALALKADVATTYNKTEVDNALATKADAATTYTKTEVDTALSTKADSSSVYSKSDTDTLLAAKADVATTYTKTEVDNALANKANSADVYAKTETYSKTEIDTNIYTKTETYNKTEVDNKINNLPAPMVMKGTLGTGGTITDLPTASSENEGFTYKVITAGTYAGQVAKTGDLFTSAQPVGSSDYIWLYIPSGDETFTDTWRGIKVNGTEKLGSSINTGSVDFKNGTNSTVVFDSSDSSIKVDVDGYTQAQVDTKLSAKANSADVYAKSETYSASEVDTKLLAKANSSDVYTQAEVDTKLSGKANTSDVYTQAQIDTKLADKADKSTTYTKTEVDNALSAKANTADVNTALDLKADKSDTYTKEEVDDKVDVSDTASGAVASFDDGSGLPFQEIKCSVNAIQEGTPWIDSNVIEKEPYNFRKVAGTASRIGNSEFNKIVGGTVAFNQIVEPKNTTNTSYTATCVFTTDGKATINGTPSGGTANYTVISNYPALSGHKYLLVGGLSDNVYLVVTNVTVWGSSNRFDKGNGTIVGAISSGNIAINIQVLENYACSNVVVKPQFIDLTAFFNSSTIADYIYSLEQATAGAGVAFFRKLFPKDYCAYNAGELMSVKTTAHKLTGFNQWDEVTELGQYDTSTGQPKPNNYCIRGKNPIKILPDTAYYCSNNNIRRLYYDANDNFISADYGYGVKVTPANAYIMRVYLSDSYGTTYHNDICVNISDTNRDGEYEPYIEHNYALDSDLELRGIPKLVNNKIEYDGDKYESSGDVTRKYGIIDLGTLNWSKTDTAEGAPYPYRWVASGISDAGGSITDVNCISSKYLGIRYNNPNGIGILQGNADMVCSSEVRGYINVIDSKFNEYTGSQVKSALSGVMLQYILSTETTETADPFTNPQEVDEYGTEEYVDNRSIAIPVGHETYYADIYDISGFTACKVSVKDGSNVEQKSATISFGQTVYGGYLEFKNGAWVFTITHSNDNLSDLDWTLISVGVESPYFQAYIDDIVYDSTQNAYLCSCFTKASIGSTGSAEGFFVTNGKYLRIRDLRCATKEEFVTAMVGQTFLYPLATPFTLTLTGAQLETLLGENRVSHNCNGDTEVKYIRQTDLLDSIEFVHNSLSPWFELVATLTAGSTSLVFTNPAITANSTIDPYVDDSFYGVSPTAVVIANGSVTLTFNAQANDIPIKVRIS